MNKCDFLLRYPKIDCKGTTIISYNKIFFNVF